MNAPDYDRSEIERYSSEVVRDVCPEEMPILPHLLNARQSRKIKHSDLAFGASPEDVLLAAAVVDSLKIILTQLWQIGKPHIKDLASGIISAGGKALLEDFEAVLLNKGTKRVVSLDSREAEQVMNEAFRSALKNGCTFEQADNIMKSVRKSLLARRS